MTDLEAELVGVVTDAIDNHPRSLQKRVGPSELGTPCARKLAYRLAQVPERDRGTPWLPTVGTAMHAWMEEAFARDSMDNRAGGRWWVETRLSVGEVDGVEVTGSCDLYDEQHAAVVDWKFVSRNKLAGYRRAGTPGEQYRTQAHLYGRGWARRGMRVSAVAIMFWTRDGQFGDRWLWSEPYREQIALDALARATTIAQLLRLLGPVTAIGLQPKAPDYCSHCGWFAPGESDAGRGCPGAIEAPATSLSEILR